MTQPTPIREQPQAESESICRRRRFRVRDKRDMARLMEMMELQKVTGSLTLHYGQGGINAAVVEEYASPLGA